MLGSPDAISPERLAALRERLAAAAEADAQLADDPIMSPDDPMLDPATAEVWRRQILRRLTREREDDGPAEPARKRRQRKPTFGAVATRLIKATRKAGGDVARVEYKDGKIVVVVAGAAAIDVAAENEWDQVLDDADQPRFRQ